MFACLGCGSEASEQEQPLAELFSFALIADPHITTVAENEERLKAAVKWINDNASTRKIEVVLVLGDIGWGQGLPQSKKLLDQLQVPYVPLIGDNEIAADDDETFEQVYRPQLDALDGQLENWRTASTPVAHPDANADVWLQNAAFEHRGVHFFALDWCVRGIKGALAEFGDLNDYTGGTWPWLETELAEVVAAGPAQESIVLLSHIPMMGGMFDTIEWPIIGELFEPHAELVWANYAGHLHGPIEMPGPGFTMWTADATWDDQNTVRLIEVRGNSSRFAYIDTEIEVP